MKLSYNIKVSQLQILIILFFLLSASSKTLGEEKVINIALSSAPTNLDPLRSTDANSQNINRLLHLSLVEVDTNMKFMCRACVEFRETREKDGHQIYFKLRDDLTFHDGTELTSMDVKNSWKYFIDESNNSIFRNAFLKISSIEIKNARELIVNYSTFAQDNLSNLVLLKLIKVNENDEVVGSGPYRKDEIRPLEVNLSPVKGHFESRDSRPLSFKVVRDETTLALKLINREIDLSVSQMSPRKERWLLSRHEKNLKVESVEGTNFIYLGVNHRSEHLQNLEVRRAVNKVLPIDDLIRYKLHHTAVRATGLFSNAFSGLAIESKNNSQSLDSAQKLMSTAGYQRNDQGQWSNANGPIVLDWKVTNNRSTIEMVEVFRHYLREFGIEVRMTIQEWGTFSRSLRNGQFDLIMGQWVGFTGPEMLATVFHSRSIPPNGANRGHFQDNEFDKLINKAESVVSSIESMEFYAMAHKRAFERLAYIPLWHPDVRWVMSTCLESPSIYSTGSFLALLNLKKSCLQNE